MTLTGYNKQASGVLDCRPYTLLNLFLTICVGFRNLQYFSDITDGVSF